MSDKKIILTGRATQDGYYENYYYKGPVTSDEGYFPGEVFQVDATPYAAKDAKGKPILVLDEAGAKIPVLDSKGKQRFDETGKPMFKIKMASFFAKEWMERVPDDTELSYPDRPKWQIPEAYRIKKPGKLAKPIPLPDELKDMGLALPAAVEEITTPALPAELE